MTTQNAPRKGEPTGYYNVAAKVIRKTLNQLRLYLKVHWNYHWLPLL
jgi:hypothetical protein